MRHADLGRLARSLFAHRICDRLDVAETDTDLFSGAKLKKVVAALEGSFRARVGAREGQRRDDPDRGPRRHKHDVSLAIGKVTSVEPVRILLNMLTGEIQKSSVLHRAQPRFQVLFNRSFRTMA